MVRNKVPEMNKDLITKGLYTLLRSLEFILEVLGRLKITFSFFFANNHSPKASSESSPHLLDCGLEPTFFGRHFTEAVLPLSGRDAGILWMRVTEVRWCGFGRISNK